MSLLFTVGYTPDGQAVEADLAELPHMLIAGTTGSGKSVFLNSIITELMERSNAQFLMIDPKRVELAAYRGSRRLVRPPVNDAEEAASAFGWAYALMQMRYTALERRGLKDISMITPVMPRLVIVVDELANVMLSDKKRVEPPLVQIASQGRAAGIHLLLATQRPSADVLTGLLRANIPARAAFATVTSIDSRIILDQEGAEKLKGHGDMLYRNGTQMWHLQGRMVSDKTINMVAGATR